jgi:hypothetical protein
LHSCTAGMPRVNCCSGRRVVTGTTRLLFSTLCAVTRCRFRARAFSSATCACSPQRHRFPYFCVCRQYCAVQLYLSFGRGVTRVQVVGGWSSGTGMSGVSGAALYFALSQAGLSNSTIFFIQVAFAPVCHQPSLNSCHRCDRSLLPRCLCLCSCG